MPELISVLIPCYNQAEYVKQAVESVIAQDYRPLEIICIDDGSKDATPAVLKSLDYSEVKVIVQENTGVCVAMQRALVAAKGEYILRLDGDDYLPHGYISALYKALAGQPKNIAYAYCDARFFGARAGGIKAKPYSLPILMLDNYIHVSALIRASVIQELGYFNPVMKFGYEDWDLWLNFAEHGYEGVYCPDTFLFYRQKAEGGRNAMREARHKQMLLQLHINHPGIYKKPINQWRYFLWRLKRKIKKLR